MRTKLKEEYYQALVLRKSEYEGLFFAGIRTTGVFCRPTCPARKPKFENCEFFATAQAALLAGFRPCKRCKPLSAPNEVPEIVRKLVEAVEAHPEKRWREEDFRKISTSSKQASRLFKKRYGMTFVAYARARRMGIALKEIKEKKSVIDAQLTTGYESGSGFRDAFSKIFGKPPVKAGHLEVLKATWIDTKLGPMLAIADDKYLYLLEFVDRRGLEREIDRFRKKMHVAILPGVTPPLKQIEKELKLYFEGKKMHFETPFKTKGSPFQEKVWQKLQEIPCGETRSYRDIAEALGRPTAYRAVAQANGSNQLALIIPCHRVVNANGDLGGYAGGLARKEWLLKLEKESLISK